MVQHSVVDLTHPDCPGSGAKGSHINSNNCMYEFESNNVDSGPLRAGQVKLKLMSKICKVSVDQHSNIDLTHLDCPGSVAKGSHINNNNCTSDYECTYLDSGRFGVGQV